MSRAVAEWVMAPTAMRSTPVERDAADGFERDAAGGFEIDFAFFAGLP